MISGWTVLIFVALMWVLLSNAKHGQRRCRCSCTCRRGCRR